MTTILTVTGQRHIRASTHARGSGGPVPSRTWNGQNVPMDAAGGTPAAMSSLKDAHAIPRGDNRPAAIAVAVVGVTGIALNVAAQATIREFNPDREFGVLAIDAVVGSTLAVCGMIAWLSFRARRPATLMLAGSFVWSLGTFALALDSVAEVWAVLWALQGGADVVVVWLALAYPVGRLGSTLARIVVGLAAALYAFVAVTRLVLHDPGRWGWCDCRPNPFAIPGAEAIYTSVEQVAPWGNLVVALLSVLTVVIRWLRGSHPWRAVNLLMTVAFATLAGVWILYDLWYLLPLPSDFAAAFWVRCAGMIAVPVIYLAGLATLRASRSRVADLVLATRDGIDRSRWEELLRDALRDARLRVLWWDPDARGYRDTAGRLADDPRQAPESQVAVLPIDSAGGPIALVLYDPALAGSVELLASMAEAIRLAVENDRLAGELSVSLSEVQDSRARLVTAGDEARRRLERDLHDGAQQLLISTSLTLQMASSRAEALSDPELAPLLDRVAAQLSRATSELRELARGIGPGSLGLASIADAIEELALRCPVPVTVKVRGHGEPDIVGQSTIYFVVAECLTNVAKHAKAGSVRVELELGDPVTLRVDDDGVGGASLSGGGIRGLADRVEATGGSLGLRSGPTGTTITVTLPARSGAQE